MGLKHGKFVATQVSAGLVGFGCVFGVVLLARRLFPGLWVELNMMKSILFGAFFITVLVASMVLWGKVLVWLGVLTKEEAKGYPYARPWEKDELDGTIDRLLEREAKQSSAGDRLKALSEKQRQSMKNIYKFLVIILVVVIVQIFLNWLYRHYSDPFPHFHKANICETLKPGITIVDMEKALGIPIDKKISEHGETWFFYASDQFASVLIKA